jgi:hypothetical protein
MLPLRRKPDLPFLSATAIEEVEDGIGRTMFCLFLLGGD